MIRSCSSLRLKWDLTIVRICVTECIWFAPSMARSTASNRYVLLTTDCFYHHLSSFTTLLLRYIWNSGLLSINFFSLHRIAVVHEVHLFSPVPNAGHSMYQQGIMDELLCATETFKQLEYWKLFDFHHSLLQFRCPVIVILIQFIVSLYCGCVLELNCCLHFSVRSLTKVY